MSCCPRKPGPPLRPDEDPSQEDIERFDRETTPCPHCGAEIYDDAEWCHKCGKSVAPGDAGKGVPTWAIAAAGVLVVCILAIVLRLF